MSVVNPRKKRNRVNCWPVAATKAEAFEYPGAALPWVTGDTFPAAAEAARQQYPDLDSFLLLCPFSGHWLAFEVRNGKAARLPGFVPTPQQQAQGEASLHLLFRLCISHFERNGWDVDTGDDDRTDQVLVGGSAAGRIGLEAAGC